MILVISNMYPSEKYPNYGVFVKNFCDKLKESEDVKIISINKTKSIIKKIYFYMTFYLKIMYHYLFKHYDLIYVHYAGYNAPPILIGNFFKRQKKLIVNVHGSDVTPEKKLESITNVFTKKLVQVADLVVVPSSYFENVVKQKYGRNINTWISPSAGIDLSIFNSTNKQVQVNKEIKIGFVSRLDKDKGWDILLYTVKQLIDDNFPIKLVMVGSGQQEKEVVQLINDLGIRDNVIRKSMLPQKELVSIYTNIDIFIFPSTREGESLGLVGLEAMACGTPVIGSDFGGIRTYVIDQYNGFLFPPRDKIELLKCIRLYSTLSEEERKNLSNNAIETAKKYDSNSVNKKLVNKIQEIMYDE